MFVQEMHLLHDSIYKSVLPVEVKPAATAIEHSVGPPLYRPAPPGYDPGER